MKLPKLKNIAQSRLKLDAFGGLNYSERIGTGEFAETENITGDLSPVVSLRRARAVLHTVPRVIGMTAVDINMNMLDGTKPDTVTHEAAYVAPVTVGGNTSYRLFIGGVQTELELSGRVTKSGSKQMPVMGSRLYIFPDNKYFNLLKPHTSCLDEGESVSEVYGSLEAHISLASENFGFLPVRAVADGIAAAFDVDNTSATQPTAPEDGETWFTAESGAGVLKMYSAALSLWSEIPSYLCIMSVSDNTAVNFADYFKKGDAVVLSGLTGEYAALNNRSCVVEGFYDLSTVYCIVLSGAPAMYKDIYTEGGTLTLSRTVPVMDYVIEASNRLWGCRYGSLTDYTSYFTGLENASFFEGLAMALLYALVRQNERKSTVNELYACKLGDAQNWSCFEGISTDSYTASVGKPGDFTGAATVSGNPVFFKENCIYTVYGDYPASFQVSDESTQGVKNGSSGSVAVKGTRIFRLSSDGICADGLSLSAAFGIKSYTDASAGLTANKLYVSMRENSAESWDMFVYDLESGLWFREDATRAKFFTPFGGDLIYYDVTEGKIKCVNATAGTAETDELLWRLQTGKIGCTYPDNKYLGRLNLRLSLAAGSHAEVYIRRDGGSWEHTASLRRLGDGVFTLPLRPRRCDRFEIRITGGGEFKLYSAAAILEKGSDIL